MSRKMEIIHIKEGNTRENNKALVFVHGVLGDDKDTWTNTSSSTYWPSLLAKEVRNNFDVYVVSYATSFLDESPVIYQLGKDLKDKLIKEGIFPQNVDDLKAKYNEVIFIAHSMGNLIVQSALVDGDTALELKVPLLISIAAPWNGSALADKAAFLFLNRQFIDMVKVEKNSFLQLLQDVWKRRNFPIRITCAAEGKDYPWFFGFGQARVVTQKSATQLCIPQEQQEFEQEDHLSIVKPKDITFPIHEWLTTKLNENEGREMPWKLRRWIGEEKVASDSTIGEEKPVGGERFYICEIRIAGKEFHESNILMQMMVLVLEDKIKALENPKCAGSHFKENVKHIIRIQPLYDHGDAPTVLAELKNQNIDIYAEYSGALLYSHLNEIPVSPPLNLDEEKEKHEPSKINEFMSSPKHPDFNKMKLLSRFGFDSGIELVILKSTAEQLGMLNDGDTTVTYKKIADNGYRLAFLGDRDLFKRRDALGGLKAKFPKLDPKKEVSLFHEEIYSELDKSDCKEHQNSEYCQDGLQGAVAIGFKTDPLSQHPKYVKVVANEGYELPKHWASPMVHKFLDHAFPDLKPIETLKKFEGTIFNEEMLKLVKEAQKLEKDSKVNQERCEKKQIAMTSKERTQQGKCDYKEEFRNSLRDHVRAFLIGKSLIMHSQEK